MTTRKTYSRKNRRPPRRGPMHNKYADRIDRIGESIENGKSESTTPNMANLLPPHQRIRKP
jgi:hypothetical protein